MDLSVADKRAWLERVDLFRDLPGDALDRLAARAGMIEFRSGQHIVTQGQVGNGLYILLEGRARIQRGDDVIATLEPGTFFGELAVLDQRPRSATVVAEGAVTCLGLASWDLVTEIERDPRLALNLLRELAGRVRFLEDKYVH
jgi:CRP/FNR family transcriptional regulator, cyclic AMP receptor protein